MSWDGQRVIVGKLFWTTLDIYVQCLSVDGLHDERQDKGSSQEEGTHTFELGAWGLGADGT